tara:strand:+ start:4544 stop:6925 length:2382 start_codon:yes stop_codon:yes gene_type:complete
LTLLKAYLIGSNDPFILAKAFLDDMLLKDVKAVEERAEKILSESLGRPFDDAVQFWKEEIDNVRSKIIDTEATIKVMQKEKHPVDLPKTSKQLKELKEEWKEAKEALQYYKISRHNMIKEIYSNEELDLNEDGEMIDYNLGLLGITFLEEEIKFLTESRKSISEIDGDLVEGMKAALEEMQDNPSAENTEKMRVLQEKSTTLNRARKKEKETLDDKIKTLTHRLQKSKSLAKQIKRSKGGFDPDYANGLWRKYVGDRKSDFSSFWSKLESQLAPPSPRTDVTESKFNSERWMSIFVESSKTIKDKHQFKKLLAQLLQEPEIKEALDERVTSDVKQKKDIPSGMASYDRVKGKIQFKGGKIARPSVRLENLKRLKELFESVESENNEVSINKIIDAIDIQMSAEKERETASTKKSDSEKLLFQTFRQMMNALRRYRKGKYPHNFIKLVNHLKDEGLQLADIIKISQGYAKEYDIREESKEWFKNILSETVSDASLLKHIQRAWKEEPEEPLEDEDLKLFKESMYDLIENAGYKLSSQKSKPYKTVFKQAQDLLGSLQRNFKTFQRLNEAGSNPKNVLESMTIEFTSLNNMFESIKGKKNKKGKPVIPEELQEDLANSIEVFNDAFEEYNVEVKLKTPMDKVSWVKRIAEDAQGFAESNKNIKDALKDSGISIEGLEHLQGDEGMTKSKLKQYVSARLPTIDRANYMMIQEVKGSRGKIKGFDEDKYNDALEEREETIQKIVDGDSIYRKDLLWIVPKRKIPREKEAVMEEDEEPEEDEYVDDDVGGAIGGDYHE